ncbi:CPBP family intramembrane glutamic endopeptidase [Methanobacterium sp.]|uniref:CPBP family intramembrane glutamic endopeptidase n=1 Tax=Methanobacterium sp. TaxID=2164 RepID=UPI0025DD618F|nr:CPBP family intramembrane glutamic endopeptidase [Methanobacterium sp.]MBI5458749.1 CPBP family intramembrane metalloprotease [Methanobacterium sp.]
MKKAYKYGLIGYFLVMICSTLAPVIFNNEQLQALVIFPIIIILAYWTKMNGKELGLEFGSLRDYVWAILYPLSICLVIIVIALVTGNIGEIKYPNEMTGKIVYLFFYTLILAFATEEGFFRGWLYGILERDKMDPKLILLLTAVAFSSWHLPLFFLNPSFTWSMLPIYITGGIIGGLIFGLLRYISGSIIVSSFSHALWNTIVYSLFGFGSTIGILGIKMTNIFSPESGLLGLACGLVFMAILWFWTSKKIGFKYPTKPE